MIAGRIYRLIGACARRRTRLSDSGRQEASAGAAARAPEEAIARRADGTQTDSSLIPRTYYLGGEGGKVPGAAEGGGAASLSRSRNSGAKIARPADYMLFREKLEKKRAGAGSTF